MVVDRDAKQLPVVDGRCASRDRRALHARLELHGRAPDLPTRFDVDGKRPLAVDDVHHAVVDGGRGELTHVVHQARVPHGHEALDVRLGDLFQRAVALTVVPHALGGDVRGVAAVVHQFVGRLCRSGPWAQDDKDHQQPQLLHDSLHPCKRVRASGGRKYTGGGVGFRAAGRPGSCVPLARALLRLLRLDLPIARRRVVVNERMSRCATSVTSSTA